VKKNGAYFLKDESANGTRLNTRMLSGSDAEVQLSDGDQLLIGDYCLSVGIVPDAGSKKTHITPADDFDLSDLIGRAAPKQLASSPASSGRDVEDILNNYVGPKEKT
jgi:predicted component of type VI protein secretion system